FHSILDFLSSIAVYGVVGTICFLLGMFLMFSVIQTSRSKRARNENRSRLRDLEGRVGEIRRELGLAAITRTATHVHEDKTLESLSRSLGNVLSEVKKLKQNTAKNDRKPFRGGFAREEGSKENNKTENATIESNDSSSPVSFADAEEI